MAEGSPGIFSKEEMKITIEEYEDSDYDQVATILKEATLFHADLDTREGLKNKMTLNPGTIFVAKVSGIVVGCVYVVLDGWISTFYHLAVKEGYRKQGIGALLVKTVEDKAKEFGAPAITATIRENHPHLEKFYGDLGYDVAVKKHQYIHKELK